MIKKKTQKTRKRRKLPQHKKSHIWRPHMNIILNGKGLKAFPLRLGRKQRCPLLQLLLNTVLEALVKAMRQEKEIQFGKENVELSVCRSYMYKTLKTPPKNWINEFSKVVRYSHTKISCMFNTMNNPKMKLRKQLHLQ